MGSGPQRTDILITDDRSDSLIALEALLNLPHYNLVQASSGRQAIERLKHFDFAVILMDVQMPEMDGFQTVAKIKEMAEFKHIPVIFITAIDKDERYVYKGYESGAVDYVFKPFDPQILKSKVSVFVELHQKNRILLEQSLRLQEHERNRRMQELAQQDLENLMRYRSLANAIPHIVWRADSASRVDYLNQEWVDYTGRKSSESLGSRWLSSFHPDDISNLMTTWRSALRQHSAFELESRIQAANGEYRFHIVKASPERNAQEEIIGWLGTCTDIEERKRFIDELANAKVMAEAASEAKTNFLANMSHEIRTPLNAVLGFADLMLNTDCDEDERTSGLTTIRRNGQLLLKIIDEVLDLSKIEAGHLQIEKSEVDLNRIFSEMHNLLGQRAKDKNLVLTFHSSSDIPRYISTDPTRLKQILINVIGNAIKFTNRGSVDVEMSYDQPELKVAVADSGIGIDPEKAHLLFQPFTQMDNSRTREFGGSGLGLALSRRLARALGGNIELKATSLNGGARFLITIEAPARAQSDHFAPSKQDSMATQPGDIKKLEGVKVLLVEDSQDNQILTSRFLTLAGAHVDIAQDGIEGIALAQTLSHDIILMDIQMPNLDGYSATSRLRKQGYDRPIIALTAHALKEEKMKCLAVGCNAYLSKPIDRINLIEQIRKCLAEGPTTFIPSSDASI